jgi:protein-S-isoprenylcysteine O-methyltransferase Ste14
LRIWSAGYIGPPARKHEFHAEHQIINGPYRLLRHPLYIGNFFLVLGVLILFNPPLWLSLLYMGLFIVMYTLISFSEKQHLREKSERRAQYRLVNLTGELSTLIVLGIIYLVYFLLR